MPGVLRIELTQLAARARVSWAALASASVGIGSCPGAPRRETDGARLTLRRATLPARAARRLCRGGPARGTEGAREGARERSVLDMLRPTDPWRARPAGVADLRNGRGVDTAVAMQCQRQVTCFAQSFGALREALLRGRATKSTVPARARSGPMLLARL